MALIPDKKLDKVQFFQSKIAPWTTNAVAIGTTSTAVTDLQTKTDSARDLLDAQDAAIDAARAATLAANNAVAAMVNAGSDIIKQIRTKASIFGDGVYTLAQIPPPALPSPVGELGKPSNFTVELGEDGSLTLKWKCTQPKSASGTVYQVFRRIGAAGEFQYIGGTGSKKFVDGTVPAGSSSVTYQLQSVRSTAVGPWAQFNVNFGVVTPGGTMTATVTETAPAKLAA